MGVWSRSQNGALEVAGQEILSKDKVPLRLNLTAGFRMTDPVQARAKVTDIKGFLYKELQFGLRAAVGTRSLDELLEDKGAIDASVTDYIACSYSPNLITLQVFRFYASFSAASHL